VIILDNNKTTSVTIKKSLIQRLTILAAKIDKPRKEIIEEVLDKYLKDSGE
jgi:predicted DNA-binding protein